MKGDKNKGCRVYPDNDLTGLILWDYGFWERAGHWVCMSPVGIGNLGGHQVVEHNDGTITVSPSILLNHGLPGVDQWHGYIERGIWREV